MIEYKVRPVIRYIVTRFEVSDTGASSSKVGEFENEMMAEDVKRAFGNHGLHEDGLEARYTREHSPQMPG